MRAAVEQVDGGGNGHQQPSGFGMFVNPKSCWASENPFDTNAEIQCQQAIHPEYAEIALCHMHGVEIVGVRAA